MCVTRQCPIIPRQELWLKWFSFSPVLVLAFGVLAAKEGQFSAWGRLCLSSPFSPPSYLSCRTTYTRCMRSLPHRSSLPALVGTAHTLTYTHKLQAGSKMWERYIDRGGGKNSYDLRYGKRHFSIWSKSLLPPPVLLPCTYVRTTARREEGKR